MALRNLNQSMSRGRICGTPHSGVLGAAVPPAGDHGPGYLYRCLNLPADAGNEYSGYITSIPAGLTIAANEDSGFVASGADGVYVVPFDLRENGVLIATTSFNVVFGSDDVVVDGAVGGATADGIDALVVQGAAIDGTVGGAVASGLQATIQAGATINCSIGAAVAAGVVGLVSTGTILHCDIGAAGASGATASISASVAIRCEFGNAIARGLVTVVANGNSAFVFPNQSRTLIVPARFFKAVVLARVRHIVVRSDMIHVAESKRSDESPVFSLDIRKELALTGDTITQVVTDIEVEEGVDPDAANMLVGSPGYSGTIISQRVGGGVSGNVYNVRFEVATSQQQLTYVMRIPVDDNGAFG